MIILDTPTSGHIPSLTSSFSESPFFSQFCEAGSSDYVVRVIFHMCGDGVLEDERYKAFMRGFCPDVRVCFKSLLSYNLNATDDGLS